MKLGNELRADGKYLDALEKFGWVVLHFGDSNIAPYALFNIGEINYLYVHDYAAAADSFKRLITSYPWSEQRKPAQKYLAEIYMDRLNDYKQAIIEYQKAISFYETARESGNFQHQIANAYFNLGNFEQQRVELNLLLDTYPDFEKKEEIYYQLANSYFIEGKLEEAMTSYRYVIETYPDKPVAVESLFQLSICLEEKEQLEEAVKVLERIMKTYPNPDIITLRIERIKKRLQKRKR